MRLAAPAVPRPAPTAGPSRRPAPVLDPPAVAALARAAALAGPLPPAGVWVAATPSGLELHADPVRAGSAPGRGATGSSEQGRLHDLACGAAVLAVRLELRHLGAEPVVRLLPRSGAATLLATVRIAGPALAPRAGHDAPTLPALLRQLREEAALEGVALELRGPAAELPLLAALETVTDTRADRLRAGMALARLDLAAARAGVHLTPLDRPWADAARPAYGGGQEQLIVHLGGRVA